MGMHVLVEGFITENIQPRTSVTRAKTLGRVGSPQPSGPKDTTPTKTCIFCDVLSIRGPRIDKS